MFPTAVPQLFGVAADRFDDTLLLGGYGAPLDFGGGPLPLDDAGIRSAFLAKFDGAGAHLWSKGFTGPGLLAIASSGAFDPAGNSVVMATVKGTIDLGGGPLAQIGSDANVVVAKLAP
jgi:hypothetical protein